MSDKIPRRSRVDLWTPAEEAISRAMEEVENVGADTRLTDAVIKLSDAQNLVADYVDEQISKKAAEEGPSYTGHHSREQVQKAFAYAPRVLHALQEAGVAMPRLELFGDGSGLLILTTDLHNEKITGAQYDLACELVYSNRPIMRDNVIGIMFCCGLVTGAENVEKETTK